MTGLAARKRPAAPSICEPKASRGSRRAMPKAERALFRGAKSQRGATKAPRQGPTEGSRPLKRRASAPLSSGVVVQMATLSGQGSIFKRGS